MIKGTCADRGYMKRGECGERTHRWRLGSLSLRTRRDSVARIRGVSATAVDRNDFTAVDGAFADGAHLVVRTGVKPLA